MPDTNIRRHKNQIFGTRSRAGGEQKEEEEKEKREKRERGRENLQGV
jgi:hypothetical protein